ncbi:MAG: ribose 5-phosphate isomerase A [Ignavibacteriales bacterium]|nr:ribose 5-phosphate isomerase A [Ignavibacteriales bacterium]
MNSEQLKKLAAEKAVEEIKSGMILGLGTGSTVHFALDEISNKIKNGELKEIVCVATSIHTEEKAKRLGIPLTTLNKLYGSYDPPKAERSTIRRRRTKIHHPKLIDLTIDGADEVDNDLNLIKGGGGALLREKVVAQASKKVLIIVDESKLSNKLGEKFFVPVEVLQYSVNAEKKFLESFGAKVTIRKNESAESFITDENNFILDANFGMINNVEELNKILNDRAGIAAHGLFVNLCDEVFCADAEGVKVLKK